MEVSVPFYFVFVVKDLSAKVSLGFKTHLGLPWMERSLREQRGDCSGDHRGNWKGSLFKKNEAARGRRRRWDCIEPHSTARDAGFSPSL